MCDKLIVGIQADPSIERRNKNKPVQSLLERQIQLLSCKYVDDVLVYETERDLERLLGIINIHKRFIGDDWKKENITGGNICDKKKIKIVYIPRNHDWSSSSLRERIKNG
jgi:glycerol-3-phosphate cytidylyltransferase